MNDNNLPAFEGCEQLGKTENRGIDKSSTRGEQ